MGLLLEIEAKRLLSKHGISVNKDRAASALDNAVDIACSIGFPVSMKVMSRDVLHKTDVGGVIVNIRNANEAGTAYNTIIASVNKQVPSAEVEGVIISPMVEGVETIIGAKKDVQFGPIVMFGLGGVFVEVLKDVSFRIVPIYKRDAASMVHEIRAHEVLDGFRGSSQVNLGAIEDALLKVSRMMEREKNIEELDINPLIVNSHSAIAVDARIITMG